MNKEEITLEELIRLATNGELPKDKVTKRKTKYERVILRFIKGMDIKAGGIRVPIYKIMYEFYTWTGAKFNEKCSSTELGRQFNKYFDRERSGKYRYYMLNNCFDMDKEAMKKAKRYYQKWHLSKKKNQRERQNEKTSNIQPSTQE